MHFHLVEENVVQTSIRYAERYARLALWLEPLHVVPATGGDEILRRMEWSGHAACRFRVRLKPWRMLALVVRHSYRQVGPMEPAAEAGWR